MFPWVSAMDETVALPGKSNAIRMRLPATVLVGKATDRDLTPLDTLATVCTNETKVVEVEVIVRVRVALPVPAALVALSVTVDTAAVVGVPVINPVAVLSDKPPGNPTAP